MREVRGREGGEVMAGNGGEGRDESGEGKGGEGRDGSGEGKGGEGREWELIMIIAFTLRIIAVKWRMTKCNFYSCQYGTYTCDRCVATGW